MKAPVAGLALPGVFAGGSWSGLNDADERLAPGKKLKSGMTVMTVIDPEALHVEASLSEKQLGHLERGMAVGVTTALTGKKPFEGLVSKVARYGSKGKYPLTVRIKASDKRLRAGLSCVVKVPKATDEEVLSVPAACVDRSEKKTVLHVLTEDGVKAVEVKLGRKVGDRVEIKSGVTAGTRVLRTPPGGE